MIGQRTTIEIDGQHSAASQAAETAEKVHDLVIGEVMQEQRAEHEIETCRAERQTERVGHQLGSGGLSQVLALVIERSYLSARITAPDGRAHVARSGTDVED